MIKDVISKIMFFITVPKCTFCGEKLQINDKALCKECLIKYENHKEMNCSHCANAYNNCTCPNRYLLSHGVKKLYKVFKYKARESLPQNSIIYSLKQDNRRDVFNFCADELSSAILASTTDFENTVITNIPRRKLAINKYGYDHAKVLAKYLAKRLNVEYISLLRSKSQKSQKQMNSKQRLENVSFEIINEDLDLSTKTVIIVDDVVTTGTSMGVASSLIRSLGAKRIFGATMSIAYRDDKLILDTSDRFNK